MDEKVYHMLRKKTGYSDADMQKRFGGRERGSRIAAHTHTHKQTYTTHTYACVRTHKRMRAHTHINRGFSAILMCNMLLHNALCMVCAL